MPGEEQAPAGGSVQPRAPAKQQQQEKPALFEGSDFEHLFNPPPTTPAVVPPPPPPKPLPMPAAPLPKGTPSAYDVEPVGSPITTPGIFLTPGRLTLVSVLAVILLGIAFFLGLLVGRS
jgi:hypothetical protein